MVTDEFPCFRAQFEDGKTWRVVHEDRCSVQFNDFAFELCPFAVRKFTIFDFITFNLADVHDKTVHELHVRHLE